MIIDTHVHVRSFSSLRDRSQQLETTEDLIALHTYRTRLQHDGAAGR